MSIILLVVGILVTAVGVVVVGFGIPINELALGQTLIIAGATALVGGLILIGLAAAVDQLANIAEALKMRPAMRPARAPVPALRPEEPGPDPRQADVSAPPRQPEFRRPEPRPEQRPIEATGEGASADEVGASAIERLRSSMGRSAAAEAVVPPANGGPAGETAPELMPPERPPEPSALEPAARSGDRVEPVKQAGLEFLLRSRAARPAQPESFDTMWPKRRSRGGADQPKGEPAPPSSTQARNPPAEEPAVPPRGTSEVTGALPPPAAGGEKERSVAILKSGVVDGMAYTLYADGSIEAQMPQGTVRFGSIAELRAHIENNS
jgi:hypothetical protein